MTLTVENALRQYARMINTLDLRHFEPILSDEFNYASQSVIESITSKAEFLAYMIQKLEALSHATDRPCAEMARWTAYGGGPCVVLAQGDKENLVCTVTARVEHGKVLRVDLCQVPPPSTAWRSGEYPT